MNANFRHRQLPYENPLANIVVIIVGILAIAISFVIGVVAIVALIAAVLIVGVALALRGWWLRHRQRGNPESTSRAAQQSATIEGEYQVVERDSDNNHGQQP